MTSYGIAMQRNSNLKEMIDRKIMEILHTGEMERSRKFWFGGSCNRVERDQGSESQQIDIAQSSSTFILIIVGVSLAVIILLFENIYIRFFKKKMKTWIYAIHINNDKQKQRQIVLSACNAFSTFTSDVILY
jgi:hypothetical protein